MELSRYRKERLLPILTHRTAIFFFLMCILIILLYAAGTVQGFIDSTQLGLLRLYILLAVFLSASSLFGFFLELSRVINLKKVRYLFRSLGYLLLTIYGISTVLGVLFIIALSEGN